MQETIKTVGFIGVGGIGRPMAEQLGRSGFDLIVCDKREAALEPFTQLGIRTTSTASDCGAADMVILMVADDAQAIAAVGGAGGLVEGLRADRQTVVAIMSTVLPETVFKIAELLAARNSRLIDAPVSGGGVRAAKGELSIMAGGDASVLHQMSPVLEALGNRIFHCGALGAGESIKILNNMMGLTAQFLMTELAELAKRMGVDLELLVQVMEASSGRNITTLDFAAQKAMFAYTTSDPALLKGIVDVSRKDMRLAQTLAEQHAVSAPLIDAIASAHRLIPYEATFEAWRSLSNQPEQ